MLKMNIEMKYNKSIIKLSALLLLAPFFFFF